MNQIQFGSDAASVQAELLNPAETAQQAERAQGGPVKRAYSTPLLVAHGQFQQVTMQINSGGNPTTKECICEDDGTVVIVPIGQPCPAGCQG